MIVKKIFFESVQNSQEQLLEEILKANLATPELWALYADDHKVTKGQRGREWISSPSKSLCFSYAIHQSLLHFDKSLLPVYAAYSVMEFLKSFNEAASLFLKWPNDILLYSEEKSLKCAGILVEAKKDYYLVGVGLNLFDGNFSDATSLDAFVDQNFLQNKKKLFDDYVDEYVKNIFSYNLDLENLYESYKKSQLIDDDGHSWEIRKIYDDASLGIGHVEYGEKRLYSSKGFIWRERV